MTILSVQQLYIQRNAQPVIQNLSFQLYSEQRLLLQGDIGTGKSTLLHTLLGFLPYQSGVIEWFGNVCQHEKDFMAIRGYQVGICFQQASDQLFGPTVLEDVAFGLLNQNIAPQQAYQQALQQLEVLDIIHLKNRSIQDLSGGEQNFVALAGVLVMQPKVLLLDEPTNGLDQKNKDKLIFLLKSLSLSMLIASHDKEFNQNIGEDYIDLN